MPETVLITGASSGIGWELAKQFASHGSRVVLTARNEAKLSALCEEVAVRWEAEAIPIAVDLSTPNAAATLCERVTDRGLQIDVLVNNAGFGILGRFDRLDRDRQLEMVQLNIAALTELTRRLLPPMIERREGGILNVGSVAAYLAGPHMSVYYASKAYVLSFSEGLREELRDTGVNVTCLAPGPTNTDFGKRSGMNRLSMFTSNAVSAESVAKAGYEGFRARRAVVIPGWKNRLTVAAVKLIPRSWSRKVAKRLQPISSE